MFLHVAAGGPFHGARKGLNKTRLSHRQQIVSEYRRDHSSRAERNRPDHRLVLTSPATAAWDGRVVESGGDHMSVRLQVDPVVKFIVGQKHGGEPLCNGMLAVGPLHG